jgi:hypothetical protein
MQPTHKLCVIQGTFTAIFFISANQYAEHIIPRWGTGSCFSFTVRNLGVHKLVERFVRFTHFADPGELVSILSSKYLQKNHAGTDQVIGNFQNHFGAKELARTVSLTFFKLSWTLIASPELLGSSLQENESKPNPQLPMMSNASLKVSLWTTGSSKDVREGSNKPSCAIISL